MTDTFRFSDELGHFLKAQRETAGMSKKTLAERAGKVREVVYRLEGGQDVTVSSLMAVLAALGLALTVVSAGLPTMAEVAARFTQDDDDDAAEEAV